MSKKPCEACEYLALWKGYLNQFHLSRVNPVWSKDEKAAHDYIVWKIAAYRESDCRCAKKPKEGT